MVAQKTKKKNIMTTMGSPKLLFSRTTGFMPPTSMSASRPAMLGQMMSMKIQPYSTPRKMPTRLMPSGVSGSMGGIRPTPNMTARQMAEWMKYRMPGVFFVVAALVSAMSFS